MISTVVEALRSFFGISSRRASAAVPPPLLEREFPPQRMQPCCPEYASCTKCDGQTDTYRCPVRGWTWTQECPDANIWRPA